MPPFLSRRQLAGSGCQANAWDWTSGDLLYPYPLGCCLSFGLFHMIPARQNSQISQLNLSPAFWTRFLKQWAFLYTCYLCWLMSSLFFQCPKARNFQFPYIQPVIPSSWFSHVPDLACWTCFLVYWGGGGLWVGGRETFIISPDLVYFYNFPLWIGLSCGCYTFPQYTDITLCALCLET